MPRSASPWFAASVLAIALTVASTASATETVVDDFESAGSPAPWTFSNGAEFPGAVGSLTSGPGHSGKGAHLAYDFSGGGHYVGALRTLASPTTAGAVDFWVRADPGIHVTLRVVDASGQTLQYVGSRPFDALQASTWYRQTVPLDGPDSHFGGANDGVVHQPISALAFLAADPTEPTASGSIDLDDVGLVDALAPAIDPLSDPVSPPPAGSESLSSRLGINIHTTSDAAGYDKAQGLGFSWARMDLGWSGVEAQKGTYDFGALDGLVSLLAQRGMHLLLILDYFNPLYPGAGDAGYETETVPAFAAMARAAAAHFAGKGVAFEIWNEPNLAGFWPPSPSATQYASLSNAAIGAVHTGDPGAEVTTAGISQFDFAFLRAYLKAGGATGADAVGVHPYRQTGGESVSDDLALMQSIVATAVSPATPVWDTEWGYSSTWYGGGHDPVPRVAQAQYAARELLSAWALGFPLAVYYDLRDDGADPTKAEDNFGLLQPDGTDKPAAVAVRTLTTLARGRTLAGSYTLQPTTLRALRLDGPTDMVVALWSTVAGAKVTVQVPAGATAVDILGAPVAIGSDAGVPSVTLWTDDGPVYVTLPVPPPVADAGVDAAAGGGIDAAAPAEGDATTGAGEPGPPGGDGGDHEQAPVTSPSGCGCGVGAAADRFGYASLLGVAFFLLRRRRAR